MIFINVAIEYKCNVLKSFHVICKLMLFINVEIGYKCNVLKSFHVICQLILNNISLRRTMTPRISRCTWHSVSQGLYGSRSQRTGDRGCQPHTNSLITLLAYLFLNTTWLFDSWNFDFFPSFSTGVSAWHKCF